MWACGIAYFDSRYRRIPNLLSLGAWLLGAVLIIVNRTSLYGADISSALSAAGFGALVTLPAYIKGRLGAGDVKYLIAIGLLTSLPITLRCFVIAAIAGGVLALAWVGMPKLMPWIPSSLIKKKSLLGRWFSIDLADRRMAYGALFSLGLTCSLWIESHS